MGITLFDQKTDAIVFDVNFWHWRAIVEAVRSLGVLAEERINPLHDQFVGELSEDEARAVAAAIRADLLPTLCGDERLLLDGRRTIEPGDGTFYRELAEQHKNYSTDRDAGGIRDMLRGVWWIPSVLKWTRRVFGYNCCE